MPAPLRTLILAPEPVAVAPAVEVLQRGGHTIAATYTRGLAETQRLLEGTVWDLVLCFETARQPLAQALVQWLALAVLDVPLIVIADDASEPSAIAAMQAGAHDYVRSGNLSRLAPAVAREMREMAVHRERLRAVAALRESEERFRQMAEHIDEVFWLADCASGRIIYVSSGYEQIWGRPVESLTDGIVPFLATVHPEDVPLVDGWLAADGWNGLNGEYRIQQPDGSVRWIRSRAFAVRDARGRTFRIAGISSDVTAAHQLDSGMKTLTRALEQTADTVMITSCDGIIEYVNGALEDVTGFSKEELLGSTPRLLRSGLQDQEFYAQMWRTLLNGLPYSDVFINRRKDGDIFYAEQTITPVRDEQGNITHFVATGKDITRRLQVQQRLHHIIHYDALTGLANRILFFDRCKQALMQARRLSTTVGLLYIGVELSDLFEGVKDKAVEERLLTQLGGRLRAVVREGETVGRLGHGEFAVLHKFEAGPQGMEEVVAELRRAVEAPLRVDGYELVLTPRIGVSLFPLDGDDGDDLVRKAAAAMRIARQEGGVCHFYRQSSLADECRTSG